MNEFTRIYQRFINLDSYPIYWEGLNVGEILEGGHVWFISDMHFQHRNIIQWCRTDTFRNVHQMNSRLIQAWNQTVRDNDKIFCLGDFGPFSFKYRLRGKTAILKGNHDIKLWNKQLILKYKDLVFLVLHNPDDSTNWFNGDWIIHGHTHINSPFIDIRRKRINVSCEVIGYRPINMMTLYSILQESEKYYTNRSFL